MGGATPSVQRLTNPSVFDTTTCPEVNASDGTPLSRHTYGGLVYLPRADRMFAWEGINYCGGSMRHTWTLDLATMTWHDMLPGGFDVTAGSGSVRTGGPDRVLDPTTTDETVICMDGNNKMLFRYDYTTNMWSKLTNYSSTDVPLAPGVVIDPAHQLMVFAGQSNENTGILKVKAIDISPGTNYAVQDWSSTITGCAALNVNYPTLTYDPALNRIVAYPGSGNSVYILDPMTQTCVGQSFRADFGSKPRVPRDLRPLCIFPVHREVRDSQLSPHQRLYFHAQHNCRSWPWRIHTHMPGQRWRWIRGGSGVPRSRCGRPRYNRPHGRSRHREIWHAGCASQPSRVRSHE